MTFRHRAGVRPYTSFSTSQSPVFLVNSRLGLFIATPSRFAGKPLHATGAPLLPKLRGHFAEFLNGGSHLRLRIFSSPTCVGLRYGYRNFSLEDFLGSVASVTLRPCGLASAPQDSDPPDLPSGSPYMPQPGALRPSPGSHSLLRPPIVITKLQ